MPRRKQAVIDFEVTAAKALSAGITDEYLHGRITDLAHGLLPEDTAKALSRREAEKVRARNVR